MKLNNITAVMNEAELAQIIMDAVKAKTSLTVMSVDFEVGTRCVGYGVGERDEPYFKGATVTFAPGQEIKSAKITGPDL